MGGYNDVIVPIYNWRGRAVDGLCVNGSAFCATDFTWPARAENATFGDPPVTDPVYGGPVAWGGSLLDTQKDGSGLVYKRNRYYDPASGRFTQVDPIGLGGGLNAYGFGGGDQVSYTDPFGLCKEGATAQKAYSGGVKTTIIECSDGTNEIRKGGTIAWRNNNPGNIEPGSFARAHGSIGKAGGRAVFGDRAAGEKAQEALLKAKYADKSIADMISLYAPQWHGNNVQAYIRDVTKSTGFSADAIVKNLSEAQFASLVKAMQQHEGSSSGTVTYVARPAQ